MTQTHLEASASGVPFPVKTSTRGESAPLSGIPEGVSFTALFKKQWLSTIILCSVFWSFGMCVAFLGPTLLDLGCQTASDMKTMSWVFFAQLFFVLIGSMISGYMANKLRANLMLTVATILLPTCMFLLSFCGSIGVLAAVLAVMGLNMGCIDCLANLLMIKLYGEFVTPFLQAMHFCYGLGAFVSPMIAEPFLLNEDCSTFIGNITMAESPDTPKLQALAVNVTLVKEELFEAQIETHVKYAFWIMALLQVPIPLLATYIAYRTRNDHGNLVEPDEDATEEKDGYDDIDKSKQSSRKDGAGRFGQWMWEQQEYLHQNKNRCCASSRSQVITITIFSGILLFLFDGLQSAFGGYVYTYGLKSIAGMQRTEGAYLNAAYWGAFALGRLFAVFVATKVAPGCMLLGNIIGCIGSMALMLALRHDHAALYVGTCAFGMFLSSITPTALALAEQYIDVTSTITAYIVTIAAMGEMVFPVVVGNIFVSLGPVSFLVFGNIMCISSLLVFIPITIIGRQTPKQLGRPSSFIWCQSIAMKKLQNESTVPTTIKYYSRMSESNSSIEMVGQDVEEEDELTTK
ncbi:major facilitator superfamily domain-containing protein 4A-like [Tubulanus polymorphus]|uniref:major facilitator superfamily domain-containing protein 4A-like n=1 Tax=Tubulanus polymorphus TaxID=672921 RepID=UPI003DA2ADA6